MEKENEEGKEKEEWEIHRDELKSQADNAYREKDFSSAISYYSEAISVDPENVILYSNRSAAYLSDKQKSKSLADARKCVELDKGFLKGYSRLASSLLSLGRYSEARGAYKDMGKLEGGEEMAQKGLEECRSLELSEQERLRNQFLQRELHEQKKKEEEAKQREKQQAESKPEDDLLDDFFNDIETADSEKPPQETKPKPTRNTDIDNENSALFHVENLDSSTPTAQIERLVLTPNAQWKNLNPFAVLQISHYSTIEDIQKRYRSLSLLVHPDKHRHHLKEEAQRAFDTVKKAMDILKDEDKRRHTLQLIDQGIKQGKHQYTQQQNPSPQTLTQIQINSVMKLFAEIEMKRRDVERRKRNQDLREKKAEDEEERKEKRKMDFEKHWKEKNRVEKRIGNWRDFQKGKKKK